MEVGKGKENLVKFVYNESKGATPGTVDQHQHSCYICNKTFHQKSSLSKHLKTHKVGDGHICQKCDKKFAASRDLRKHVDIVHLNKAEEYKKDFGDEIAGKLENFSDTKMKVVKQDETSGRYIGRFKQLKDMKPKVDVSLSYWFFDRKGRSSGPRNCFS